MQGLDPGKQKKEKTGSQPRITTLMTLVKWRHAGCRRMDVFSFSSVGKGLTIFCYRYSYKPIFASLLLMVVWGSNHLQLIKKAKTGGAYY